MIRRVVLIYPAARRYSGFLSAQRMPGLVVTHAGLTILAQMLHREGITAPVYDEQITPFAPWMVEGADLVGREPVEGTPGGDRAMFVEAKNGSEPCGSRKAALHTRGSRLGNPILTAS